MNFKKKIFHKTHIKIMHEHVLAPHTHALAHTPTYKM